MDFLHKISMPQVYEHYLNRERVHREMTTLYAQGNERDFVYLALGITDPAANYSAHEHGLGKKVLRRRNAIRAVFDLATDFHNCDSPGEIPNLIISHSIGYLKISVGSEIAMLMKPDLFWVANVRTVWAYLLIKHADNIEYANEELRLYRDGERSSEMNYEVWSELHRLLETSQVRLHDLGIKEAAHQKASIGRLKYPWADAIASELYSLHTP